MKYQWLVLHLGKGLPITEVAKISGFHRDTPIFRNENILKAGLKPLKIVLTLPIAIPMHIQKM